MYGCESWTIKKAEHQRIDAFELWCWRRLSRVPWTARRSNQSILKEISPECSLEGLMLKLKIQYFGHLMWRFDSLEKTQMLGRIGGRRRRGRQRMRWMDGLHHWLDGHGFGWTLGVGDGQGGLACCNSWGRKELNTTEQLNWTKLTQIHAHWVSDTIQPSHPLSSPSPPALNISQHQGLFKWVSSSHQVAKVSAFQLQHQSFQWTPKMDHL